MERAVDALMPVVVDRGKDLLQERRGRRDVEAALQGDHAISDGPWGGAGAHADFIVDSHQRRISGLGMAQALHEIEPGCRDGQQLNLVVVAA
jgi:hypothetical protein